MLRRRVLAAVVNAPPAPACCRAAVISDIRRRWHSSPGSVDDDLQSKQEAAAAERQYTFMRKVSAGSPLADHLDPRTGRPFPFPGVAASVEVNMSELYELDEDSLLGHGNFGVVHAATDKRTGGRVAIKAINKASRGYSPELVAQESNILGRVDHPCAAGLLNTHEDRAYYYVVSPLYEGGELFDTLIARGHLSEADAAYITKQLLEVLEHCHDRRIVHRDLKPENILLRHPPGTTGTHSEELAIAVVDFGVAAIVQPGQRLTARCGSAHYMAPEVIKGSYTQSAELWSVGVILYILLSGEMPFTGRCALIIHLAQTQTQTQAARFKADSSLSLHFTSTVGSRIWRASIPLVGSRIWRLSLVLCSSNVWSQLQLCATSLTHLLTYSLTH